MSELAAKKSPPCDEATKPMSGSDLDAYQRLLGKGWNVMNGHHLEKSFNFKDFRQALNFTNEVGELAENVGHHPDIYLTWGEAKITIFTHKVDGLTENDFVLAAKIEEQVNRGPTAGH